MFILRNTAMFQPVYILPSVFDATPYPAVEGSIWTLRHEVLCHVGILLAGMIGLLHRRGYAGPLLGAYLVFRALIQA